MKTVNITPWMMLIILKQPLYIPNCCCSQGYYQYSLYFRDNVFKLGQHQLWDLACSEWALSIRLVSIGFLFQLGCTRFGFSLVYTQYSYGSVVQIFVLDGFILHLGTLPRTLSQPELVTSPVLSALATMANSYWIKNPQNIIKVSENGEDSAKTQ